MSASNEIRNTELECCVQLPPLLRREASSVRWLTASRCWTTTSRRVLYYLNYFVISRSRSSFERPVTLWLDDSVPPQIAWLQNLGAKRQTQQQSMKINKSFRGILPAFLSTRLLKTFESQLNQQGGRLRWGGCARGHLYNRGNSPANLPSNAQSNAASFLTPCIG